MSDPEQVNISEEKLVLPSTEQAYINVGRKNKIWALCRILDTEKPKAIVFCQTKRMVDILAKTLTSYGYPVAALHGDLTQARRVKVLDDFRSGRIMVLIATDVAARGLVIEGVTHVINYDIPQNPEVYVHRIGRTGRAGKEGKAITFVTSQEEHLLKGIKDFGGAGVSHTDVPEGHGKDRVRKVYEFDEAADIFASTNEVFRDSVMGGRGFGPAVGSRTSSPALVRYVAAGRDAIGIVGLDWARAEGRDSVKTIALSRPGVQPDSTQAPGLAYSPAQAYVFKGYYPLSVPVMMYLRTASRDIALGFISFVAGAEGQKIFVKNRLVPVTMPVRLVQLTSEQLR